MQKLCIAVSPCCESFITLHTITLPNGRPMEAMVCHKCGQPLENLPSKLGVFHIMDANDYVHTNAEFDQTVGKLSMEKSEDEGRETICGTLKDAYALVEKLDGVEAEKVRHLLKMSVVFAKKMSKGLYRYHRQLHAHGITPEGQETVLEILDGDQSEQDSVV